jgi:hypothetical protein
VDHVSSQQLVGILVRLAHCSCTPAAHLDVQHGDQHADHDLWVHTQPTVKQIRRPSAARGFHPLTGRGLHTAEVRGLRL